MNRILQVGVVVLAAMAAPVALAATYIGTIVSIEVWSLANVAFTLSVAGPCNGQYILNASSPGTKNMYAALLAAKHAGKAVRVYQSTCGPADNFGSSYAVVDYLYVDE
jgi:exo-beta-1,3-glucanase (GH17 family)